MDSERWQNVERLYHAAMECEEDQRAVFLARACSGDQALLQEVESLVSCGGRAGGFIEGQAVEAVAAEFAADKEEGQAPASDIDRSGTKALRLGQAVSHYRVTGKLGAGGMGVVYEAEDIRLQRRVALKFLPDNLARDPKALQRFQREAHAASSLNHPGICTIHEVEEHDGQPVIVMELLEGENLRERLCGGPMPIAELLELGIQTSDALGAAHAKGIIHRDIKPANVFMTSAGRVKILDFGVAKAISSPQPKVKADEESLTGEGVVVGTTAYMSPEQVRGEEIDGRSDLFSLGVVLYEAATGRRPFDGNNNALIVNAILNAQPVPPDQVNQDLPAALGTIIAKSLEKDREQRYQNAPEMQADLDRLKMDAILKGASRLQPVAASGFAFAAEAPYSSNSKLELEKASRTKAGHRSRAKLVLVPALALVLLAAAVGALMKHGHRVLPLGANDAVFIADFENHTGDPRFDDALLTAFTVSLSQSRNVNVFPRSRLESVLRLMGKSGTQRVTVPLAREICARESVRGLIANTITRTGQEFELTTELIDPETGATVRSYKEPADSEDHILDALDRIAKQVRGDLGESLYEIHQASRPLPEVTTTSLTALKKYSEASSIWMVTTRSDDALTLYKAAIQLDPEFAMAHAALGRAYCSFIYYKTDLGREEYDKALALSSRLTERERMIIEAHRALDLNHVEEADGLYRSYLATYPDDWNMLRDYANLLRRHARQAEAIEQHKRILAIAPNDVRTWIEMATAYSSLQDYSQAVQAYTRAFQIDPSRLTFGSTNREYGLALIGNREEQRAVALFSDLLGRPDIRAEGLRSLALLDLLHGRYFGAQGRLVEELQIEERKHNVFAAARTHFLLAVVAEGLGDNRARLQQLDNAAVNLKDMGPKVEWGSIVGQEYVRAGALVKAGRLAEFIRPLADVHDNEQQGYVRLLQGAITAEKGETKAAIAELSLVTDPMYGASVSGLATEILAHAYQLSGNLDQATVWYEKLASPLMPLGFWEPQQKWAFARYQLALDYEQRGQTEKARQTLATLLDWWKDADGDLPLRKAASRLQARLVR